MNNSHRLLWLLLVSAYLHNAHSAQVPAPGPYTPAEQDCNHKVWQRVTWIPDPFGSLTPVTNSYTELQTAMARLVNGQWVDCSEQMQLTPTGAAATNTQHAVALLGNINAQGSVDLTTPEGFHLVSNILGLSYFDTASGQSVWVGETKDSNGELLPSGNEALFPDAFSGCSADVLYVNGISRFEQIVILRTQLPSCTQWGLNPATTLLGVVTEFTNPPQPTISQQTVDGAVDQNLDFGIMQMGPGEAFAIGAETNRVPVTKQWLLLNGRQCLVEQVPLEQVAPMLANLPPPGTASIEPHTDPLLHKLIAASRSHSRRQLNLPLPAPKLAGHQTPPLKMAKVLPTSKGLALDYTLLTSQTNPFVFQADTVYYVSGAVNLSSTNNIIEGLTVVKFTNSTSASMSLSGVTWKTRPYAPAIFTAKDDDTVGLGDLISGSTGNPTTNFYAGTALDLSRISNPTVSNARFSYLNTAFKGTSLTVRDAQFTHCATVVGSSSLYSSFYNALFYQIGTAVTAYKILGSDHPIFENVTAHFCTNFLGDTTGTINLTNCLFAGVNSWYSTTTHTNSSIFLASDGGVFQLVGAASHYLADQSPYRNFGTTNIDATLTAELRLKTTYPPVVYSNATLAADTTFSPQAQRDSDQPDIGFHYDPLDFSFGGCTANGNLAFEAGTCAAWFRTSSGWDHAGQGIHLTDTKIATFNGTATAPAWWVRYNTAQEQATTNWSGGYGPGGITGWASSLANSPEIHATFLHSSILAGEGGSGNPFADDNGYLIVRLEDSELNGGSIGGYSSSELHTNCLFERTSVWLTGGQTDTSWVLRNCTAHGGAFTINRSTNGTPVTVRDCTFDSTAVSTSDSYSGNPSLTDYDYNAFLYGNSRTTPNGTHDVIVTNSYNWQSSWFGNYYLPTNSTLINVGWVTADVAGLYHFTTQTNQTVEGTSLVDLGYHYVATDSSGNPLDTNGDGIPDYISDSNGNGIVDSGEIGWNIAGDLGLKVLITRPAVGSIIP